MQCCSMMTHFKLLYKLCNKVVVLKNMRIHVGQHILKLDDHNQPCMCGFCSKSTSLVNTSKKNNEKKSKVSSTCDYAYNFNLKSSENYSRRMPCCNRPLACPFDGCRHTIWFYIPCHYRIDHGCNDVPDHLCISEMEKKWLLLLDVRTTL